MSRSKVTAWFAPAPQLPRLPDTAVRRLYPQYRWRIMESTFLGYAMFYLVRNNFAVVSKDVGAALAYDHAMLGNILAISALSYGLGKFVMGAVSDRSNPRVFMACGLLFTALCNFAFGSVASYPLHLALWSLNGFFQGMGWPPCGRSVGHWFSKQERGLAFSIWNTSTNVGGGLAGVVAAWAASSFGGWQYAFHFPGALAAVGSLYLFWRLCDTPQSVGLPPIEEYRSGHAAAAYSSPQAERELTTRELLLEYVLTNRYIWVLAIANFFAYITRYSMLDWGPMYLREVKGATITGGGFAIFFTEFGGIPSTILLGWLSDRLGGRRGMVAVLALVPILAAFAAILLIPPGYLWLDLAMLSLIGLFIYPVLTLIMIMSLDLTSKKAVGTAAGFVGLFGYLGRTCENVGFGWVLKHGQAQAGAGAAWNQVIWAVLACTTMAIVLMTLTWKLKPRDTLPGPDRTT